VDETGLRLDLVIRSVTQETASIRSYELVSVDGVDLPDFEAGAHVELAPRPGLMRQYSIASSPADRSHYLLGIKREAEGKGGSRAIHDEFAVGRRVRVSEPKNRFRLRADAQRSLLLSAGIGITPILSMAHELARNSKRFELHHYSRSEADVPFRGILLESAWADRVAVHNGLMPPSLDANVSDVIRQLVPDMIYVCGPAPFIELARATAAGLGIGSERVISEHFSAEPRARAVSSCAFRVRLARSDLVLEVPPDRSILDMVREAGIDVVTSCEQGVCGTCLTRVLSGTIAHKDVYLTDDERAAGDAMAICVSRPTSDELVLDL